MLFADGCCELLCNQCSQHRKYGLACWRPLIAVGLPQRGHFKAAAATLQYRKRISSKRPCSPACCGLDFRQGPAFYTTCRPVLELAYSAEACMVPLLLHLCQSRFHNRHSPCRYAEPSTFVWHLLQDRCHFHIKQPCSKKGPLG